MDKILNKFNMACYIDHSDMSSGREDISFKEYPELKKWDVLCSFINYLNKEREEQCNRKYILRCIKFDDNDISFEYEKD